MNVALFGGTFDPPHIGHLVIADQALTQLRLDQVWFAPVGQPPHKPGRLVSAASHRVAMTRIAIATHAGFRVCETDVERPAPHYSLTLMQTLIAQHPEHTFTFLIGEDSLADMPKWHQPAALFALVNVVVAQRPGAEPNTAVIDAVVPGAAQRVRWIDTPMMDLSSTDLRLRLAAGHSTRYLLPRAVAEYAVKNQLYLRPEK
jgi:nicotinate-nucleotide adenylyltransferase